MRYNAIDLTLQSSFFLQREIIFVIWRAVVILSDLHPYLEAGNCHECHVYCVQARGEPQLTCITLSVIVLVILQSLVSIQGQLVC